MFNLIIILGSPNTSQGELLRMAKGRLDKGLELFQEKNDAWKILLTGGFGPHFNTTDKPHAFYASEYLKRKGIADNQLTEFALSCDTVADGLKAKPIIENNEPDEIIVVSSDFHMQRVQYIFSSVLSDYRISFHASLYLDNCNKEIKKKLLSHEENELAHLKKYGSSKLMSIKME